MKIQNLKGLQDEKLSPDTRAVFEFLVHCAWNPDKYDLSPDSLATHMKMDVEKIHSSMEELRGAQYVTYPHQD